MSRFYGRYDQNKDAAEHGVWLTGFPDGVQVKVRSSRSMAVRRLVARLIRETRQTLLANEYVLPPETQDANEIETVVGAVVTGWKNMKARDGSPLEYSREAAYTLFTELPEFRAQVMAYADNPETFRQGDVKPLEGNSDGPSAPGSPSTGDSDR